MSSYGPPMLSAHFASSECSSHGRLRNSTRSKDHSRMFNGVTFWFHWRSYNPPEDVRYPSFFPRPVQKNLIPEYPQLGGFSLHSPLLKPESSYSPPVQGATGRDRTRLVRKKARTQRITGKRTAAIRQAQTSSHNTILTIPTLIVK